jgi:hypothetical protein
LNYPLGKNLWKRAMTFRTDTAFATAFALFLLCAGVTPAGADTATNKQAPTGSYSRHAYVAHRQHKYAATLPSAYPRTFQPYYRELPPPRYSWGAPPLQDVRDAWHGYFANPIDDPSYYGSGRSTLIFR